MKLILSSKVRKVTVELGRSTKSLNRVRVCTGSRRVGFGFPDPCWAWSLM
jgi:hypothetical protein